MFSKVKNWKSALRLQFSCGCFFIWHTLEVLVSGSVLFDVKDNLYTPLGEGDLQV